MKQRTRLALIIAAAVFAVLFIIKLVSELSVEKTGGVSTGYINVEKSGESSDSRGSFNYATEKLVVPQGGGQQVVDQKYERVADVSLISHAFDADAANIRSIASAASAVVQSENAYGLPGSRTLFLQLGVVPAAFDSTAEKLKGVGKLLSITVTKTDRTGDFRVLEAKRLSLEKTRDGLKALRTGGAALSDLIALETKILEIEGQIQELGVSLGDFSESKSFCTIKVSLSESTSVDGADVFDAVLDSLGWALLVELGIAAVLFFAAGIAALVSLAYEKYRKARGDA